MISSDCDTPISPRVPGHPDIPLNVAESPNSSSLDRRIDQASVRPPPPPPEPTHIQQDPNLQILDSAELAQLMHSLASLSSTSPEDQQMLRYYESLQRLQNLRHAREDGYDTDESKETDELNYSSELESLSDDLFDQALNNLDYINAENQEIEIDSDCDEEDYPRYDITMEELQLMDEINNANAARIARELRLAASHQSTSNVEPIERVTSKSDEIDNHFILTVNENVKKPPSSHYVTKEQHENGSDIQGINWRQYDANRSIFREQRELQYSNETKLPVPEFEVRKKCLHVKQWNSYYNFLSSSNVFRPGFYHVQLRHLLAAHSTSHVYAMSTNKRIVRWNSVTDTYTPVFQFNDQILICSLQIEEDLLMVGGMHGELWVFNVRTGQQIITNQRLSNEEDSICNAITVYDSCNGNRRVLVSNNDSFVRSFDYPSFNVVMDYNCDWAVNYAVGSPVHGRTILIVGDSKDCLVVDSNSGERIHTLVGHTDYSFSASIHKDGILYATASQDCTTRIWDIRHTRESLHCISARMAPMRSVRFSSDGTLLCIAEASDYLHVHGVANDFATAQTIDVFGEISGFALSDDDSHLYVGIKEQMYGCVVAYERYHMQNSWI